MHLHVHRVQGRAPSLSPTAPRPHAVSATGPPVRSRLEFPVAVCPTCGCLDGPQVKDCVLSRCTGEMVEVHDSEQLRQLRQKS